MSPLPALILHLYTSECKYATVLLKYWILKKEPIFIKIWTTEKKGLDFFRKKTWSNLRIVVWFMVWGVFPYLISPNFFPSHFYVILCFELNILKISAMKFFFRPQQQWFSWMILYKHAILLLELYNWELPKVE